MTAPSVPPLLDQEGPLKYLLKVPARSRPRSRPPVLVFLHGLDEGAPLDIEIALTHHGPLRPGNTAASLDTFIIVAPQMPLRGDLWERYGEWVQAILARVQEEHRGNPRRSYLTGFSYGGNGVFDLSRRQPDTWAALWAVDPTRVPERNPGRPVWLSFGEVARSATLRFVRALQLHPASNAPDGDRLYLDQGADHVGSATLAYQDERIYTWLLSKELRDIR